MALTHFTFNNISIHSFCNSVLNPHISSKQFIKSIWVPGKNDMKWVVCGLKWVYWEVLNMKFWNTPDLWSI